MTPNQDSGDGFEAYRRVRLEKGKQIATLRQRATKIDHKAEVLHHMLRQESCRVAIEEQGKILLWSRLEGQLQKELSLLARQPWLTELKASPDKETIRIGARFADGSPSLLLAINLKDPAVRVLEPGLPPEDDTLLFRVSLEALAAEGRLSEVVAACAARLSRPLSRQHSGPGPGLLLGVRATARKQLSARLRKEAPSDPPRVQLEDLSRQLAVEYRALFALEEQIRRVQSLAQDAEVSRQLEQEYQTLLSLPGLQSLKIDGQRVELVTETIVIGGRRIGSLRVSFDLARKVMSIANLTNPVVSDGVQFQHPHVREGRACLGNIARHINRLMAEHDLARLIPLTLDFLRSVNAGDVHLPLSFWPRA